MVWITASIQGSYLAFVCMLTRRTSIQKELQIVGGFSKNTTTVSYILSLILFLRCLKYSFSCYLYDNNHVNIYFYLKKIQLEA